MYSTATSLVPSEDDATEYQSCGVVPRGIQVNPESEDV
jgi:hypothetical protein